MLLEDVDFYQHFPPRIVQLYKNKKDPASKRKCTSNNVYKKFLQKAYANDVKALIQQVPIMLLISKSSSVSISSTGPFYDRKFGKCEKAEEIREFIHPRMSVYLLEKNKDPNAACKESEVEDDNALPVVMLNRFKNSSMFSDIPKPEMDVSEYYSRKITLDPSYQKKFTYINSFGNRKTKSSSSKEKIEHEALKDQVGKLQKDLKSKDEEIANMKAAMRNIKKK